MIYIAILLVLGILSIIEYWYSFEIYDQIYLEIKKYLNLKRAIYIVCGVFLICFAGFRYYTGFDFSSYVNIFEAIANGKKCPDTSIEITYKYLNLLISKLMDNYMLLFFLMALVTLGVKFLFIERINKKMKNTILFSLFIYFSMYFLVYDMGQIRSSFAQGMGLISMFLYIKGYKKLAIIPILVGATIHNSCVILFLLYILGEKRLKVSTMIIFYGVFLVIGQFLNLSNISYLVSLTNNQAFINKFLTYTANPLYAKKIGLSLSLLFQFFVLVLVILARWYFDIKDKKFDFILNMYLTGAFLYLLFNNYFVLGIRLSAYFNLSIVFLIPKIVSMIKNKWIRILVVLGFTMIMSVMVLRELQVNGTLFLPYRMKFLW